MKETAACYQLPASSPPAVVGGGPGCSGKLGMYAFEYEIG